MTEVSGYRRGDGVWVREHQRRGTRQHGNPSADGRRSLAAQADAVIAAYGRDASDHPEIAEKVAAAMARAAAEVMCEHGDELAAGAPVPADWQWQATAFMEVQPGDVLPEGVVTRVEVIDTYEYGGKEVRAYTDRYDRAIAEGRKDAITWMARGPVFGTARVLRPSE